MWIFNTILRIFEAKNSGENTNKPTKKSTIHDSKFDATETLGKKKLK